MSEQTKVSALHDVHLDPLWPEAIRTVRESRSASTAGLQRRMTIGYNRACRMIEAMEDKGWVSPMGLRGDRVVLPAIDAAIATAQSADNGEGEGAQACPHSQRCDCLGACKYGFAGNGATPTHEQGAATAGKEE